MTEDQRHAQFMKTFAINLESHGLRSPKYYEDKSQCISFVEEVDPIVKGYTKADFLKAGYIEPKDLTERLRQLKPSENFELHEYQHPDMWTKPPPSEKERPSDRPGYIPAWLPWERQRAFDILGRCHMAHVQHLWRLLTERWEKIALSIDRTPLPDLDLLKNMDSSPNGTLYPRYLVEGLYTLRELAEIKASDASDESEMEKNNERIDTISDWKDQHPDVKLNDHPVSIFRTWPSDLMDKLDEIDRQGSRVERSSYIGFLEEAEKKMQELLKFWTECGLITGQRTPPSPDVLVRREYCGEKASRADCSESGENQCPNNSVSSSPTTTQDKKSFKLQERFPSSPVHKSETKMRPPGRQNKWYGRLRSNTKTVKASWQTSRSSSSRKSTHKPFISTQNIWDGRLRSRARIRR